MWKKSICYLSCLLALGMTGAAFGDLVGHWAFDEGGGAQAADSSGMGNNGTIVNNPTWIAGMYGKALEFHGLGRAGGGGDHVNCGSGASLDIRSQISIALWIRPGADDPEGKGTETAPMAKAMSSMSPSWSWQVRYGWGGAPQPNMAFTFNTSPRAWAFVGRKLDRDEWAHIACSHDGSTLTCYLNGERTDSTPMGQITSSGTPVLIGTDGWGCDWIGAIDDVRIYNHGLTPEEIADVMAGGGIELAKEPYPEDGAMDVPCGTGLSWTAGEFADTHDVYFGAVFDDVNDADRTDPRGILVSQGQADTVYAPENPLEYGQTYYWRIDEVNAAPDYTIFKGQTWSFTVEPYGYPIANVTATASSAQPGMGAQNAVNGSGLDDLDQHGTEPTTMWMSAGVKPNWIQFEFDKVYKLHELLVWNSNQLIEGFLGFGAKDVTIEYSADGATWATLEDVPEFAKAPGTTPYAANTTVSLGGAVAKYVKLTINTNWGGMATQTGLSEVRFFYVPLQAFYPEPADGAAGVSVETDLGWRPGREAASHVVYIGTDGATVAAGAVSGKTVTKAGYTSADLLLKTQYFWKVDEVGDTGTYAGDVWSFTTEEYVVVEDFESYDDDVDAETTIWHAWIDGLTDGKSGSQVGYDVAPFAEKTTVHGGRQAMPLKYSNVGFAFSEATLTFDSPQDWTTRGIKALSLFFAGAAGNGGQLYLKINSTKVAYSGNAADLAQTGWQEWKVDLTKIGNVKSVRSLTIGVEGAGTSGMLYIDDIRLAP